MAFYYQALSLLHLYTNKGLSKGTSFALFFSNRIIVAFVGRIFVIPTVGETGGDSLRAVIDRHLFNWSSKMQR